MKDLEKTVTGYYYPEKCNLNEFREIIAQKLRMEATPHASEIEKNIPIYDISLLKTIFKDEG